MFSPAATSDPAQGFAYADELLRLTPAMAPVEPGAFVMVPPATEVASLGSLGPLSNFMDAVTSPQVINAGASGSLTPMIFALLASLLTLLAIYLARVPRDHRIQL